jgi:predicted DNA-binding transcriptional regulator AlpA
MLTPTSTTTEAPPLPELLDRATILTRVLPVSDRTFTRMLSTGKFPPPDLRMSAKLLFWRRQTVLDWLAEQGT